MRPQSQRRIAWIAAFAVCVTFWLIFFGSLFAVGAFAHCRTHRCWHRVSVHRHAHWLHMHRPWIYAWRHLTAWERTWARCIANHETRGIPWSRKRYVATGNGYYGSVQFLPSTWHAAGGTGLPTQHTLYEQLVRTVRWAHAAGSSQWSTSKACGSV